MEEIRFDHVIETYLFFQLVLGRVWAPFWEGLGTVLGRFGGGFGASWPLLCGLLALFFASLTLKRSQERSKRAQEASKSVPELDFGGFWGCFGKNF